VKLPAIQFYTGDWRKDVGVQALNYFDRGIWFEMLLLMHESEQRGKLLLNGHPMSDDMLARVLGVDKQILTTTISTLLSYGVASRDEETGALISRRMVRDETVRQRKIKAGKMGGNPALLKHDDKQNTTTMVKQKRGSSSSVSSSDEPTLFADDSDSGVGAPVSKKTVTASLSERQKWFEDFWSIVWTKVAVGAARKLYLAKVRTPDMRDKVYQAAKRQGPGIIARAAKSGSTPVYPSTWLSQERYSDQIGSVAAPVRVPDEPQYRNVAEDPGLAAYLAQHAARTAAKQ
jgi:hypothetical protein